MAVYITLTVVTVLLSLIIVPAHRLAQGAFSRQHGVNRAAWWLVFGLLSGVSACRIAVGNDYWVYRQYILFIAQNRKVATEFGFNWLVRLVQFLTRNDECYLVVLGIFSFATVFLFLKALYEQSDWFAGSLFLLLTGGYYFLSLNSVRYYFALALAMCAMRQVLKGDYLKFILMVLAGACFHKSILVVLVLYPLAKIRWKKWAFAVALAICGSMIFLKDLYREVIFLFYPYYENSMFDTGDVSVINILKSVAVVILAFLFYRQSIAESEKNRFYLNLQAGALMLYCFGSFIPEISRIGYYLNISMVFLIPGILVKIENKRWRRIMTAAVALAFIAYFAVFLRGAYDISIRILPYRNWIFD